MSTRAVVVLLFAASALALAADKTTAELVTEAAAAPVEKQPALYIKAAQQQLKAADRLYDAGNVEDARRLVQDVAEYSTKASDAATSSGKRLKRTEIDIRKMAERLSDVQHSLTYEDQPPVKAVVDQLEKLRTKLLERMFSPKEKK
jgi:hypothetical protein